MEGVGEKRVVEAGADDVARSVSSTPLLNRTHVRAFALDYCTRSERVYVRKKMKRVSEEFMVALNTVVKEWVRKRVDGQPSVGMTLR